MPTPRVTVLLPVYNARAFVAEAVRSVLDQTFGDFELVAIDDGSTDGSAEVLSTIADPRLRILRQENRGLIATLNRGIAEATGELIARMDADDISLPDRFAKQVAYLDAHPKVVAVGGAAQFFTDAGPQDFVLRHPNDPAAIRQALAKDSAIVHPTAMIRRDALTGIGGYRRAFVDAEDYDLWLRLAEKHDLANLDDVVLHYRVHAGQVSVRKACQQALSKLGCQAAARLRRERGSDPADSVDRITYQVLRNWGVDTATIEQTLFAVVDGQFEFHLRAGDTAKAESVVADVTGIVSTPSRWGRSRLAWYAAKLAIAGGRRSRGMAGLAKACLLDPALLLRLFRAAGRRA